MFPEKAEVGFVGRAPAEKEELVLGDDGFAKFTGRIALELISGRQGEAEGFCEFWSSGFIAF